MFRSKRHEKLKFIFEEEKFSKKIHRKPVETIDDEELEQIQSDVEEELEEKKEGSIDSESDDEQLDVEDASTEGLFVLPLYAILSSEKQNRVNFFFARIENELLCCSILFQGFSTGASRNSIVHRGDERC